MNGLWPASRAEPSGEPAQKSVCICICTFKRPRLLRKLLEKLEQQVNDGRLTLSISVADNDEQRSAEATVADFARSSAIRVTYERQPVQNIALARNTALKNASADYIAFIDDDEFPVDDWLLAMIGACDKYRAAGVLGPVRPHFEETPPPWILRGDFFERPEPPTGTIMQWDECRTGNVLLRSVILGDRDSVFDPAFGSGGEDKDFFMRMIAAGHVFCWCNEGPVYETVPKERLTRAYLLKRAMLRGRNILKHPAGRTGLIMKSLAAAPAYLVVMPLALLRGQHVFMRYAIRFCDHAGRLMALVGVNPVRER